MSKGRWYIATMIVVSSMLFSHISSAKAYTHDSFQRSLVTLTFDDGWRSQYTGAFPLLNNYNMRAMFYIITGQLGIGDYMSAADIINLHNSGNEIGSHTVSHPDLTRLTLSEVSKELQDSKNTALVV